MSYTATSVSFLSAAGLGCWLKIKLLKDVLHQRACFLLSIVALSGLLCSFPCYSQCTLSKEIRDRQMVAFTAHTFQGTKGHTECERGQLFFTVCLSLILLACVCHEHHQNELLPTCPSFSSCAWCFCLQNVHMAVVVLLIFACMKRGCLLDCRTI